MLWTLLFYGLNFGETFKSVIEVVSNILSHYSSCVRKSSSVYVSNVCNVSVIHTLDKLIHTLDKLIHTLDKLKLI